MHQCFKTLLDRLHVIKSHEITAGSILLFIWFLPENSLELQTKF